MDIRKTAMTVIGAAVLMASFWYVTYAPWKAKFLEATDSVYDWKSDPVVNARDSIIITNAWNHYPASRPFLDSIVAANRRYAKIFPYPLEYSMGLHLQEATTYLKGDSTQPTIFIRFDSLAISSYPAVGIGQFTRVGALETGMSTYDSTDAPELYAQEMHLQEMSDLLKIHEDNRLKYLALHDKDSAMISQLAFERLRSLLPGAYRKFRKTFLTKSKDTVFQKVEQRINPWISIDRTAYKLAKDAQSNLKYFNSDTIHAVLRALPSYNAGLGQTQRWYGLPNIPETVNHYRMIKLYADTLAMRKIPKRMK